MKMKITLICSIAFSLICAAAQAGYADREPACGPGQELDAGLCYDKCSANETGVGPVCWGKCPKDTNDYGAVCSYLDIQARPTQALGVGTIPDSCPAGAENNAGLCYPLCRSGYWGVGPVCWEVTPSGWIDMGLFFMRFSPGLEFRGRGSYGRGVGTIPNVCPAGKFNTAGLCYPPCPAGYSQSGLLCQKACPTGYQNDGLFCRKYISTTKSSHGRGVGVVPPGNNGYCSYEMPLKTKLGADRRYSQTAFVGTHNSYANSANGYMYANQTFDVQRQLEGGVRVINLDIHIKDGDVVLCHDNCNGAPLINYGTSTQYLVDTLRVIKNFLEKNKKEIVTIIFESQVKNNAIIEEKIAYSGLKDMVFSPRAEGISQFPTLREMISQNKRVVIFSQESRDAGVGVKLEWSYFVENMWGFDASVDNYSVTPRNLPLNSRDRGFLLNHFGMVSPLHAARNNSVNVLRGRVFNEARTAAGRLPTILLVDFYQLPFCEAFKTVKDINDSLL